MRPELLLTAPPVPVSRYRRRILGLGFALVLLLVAVGAPLYVRGIERDLERRVPDELAAVGFTDLTASFSGQEGVLRCPEPLPDPEAVLERVHGIDGVSVVTLDRSCRVSSAPSVATLPSATSGESIDDPADTGPVVTDQSGADDEREGENGAAADDASADQSPPTTAAGFATVDELIRSGSRFSLFANLVAEAGRTDLLGGVEPITLFAPDNAAFDGLTADVLAELRNAPELLAEVIDHHVVAGAIPRAELVAGEVETLGGDGLVIAADGASITVDGALVATDDDLVADNGVVHGIDRVLLPDDLPLRSLAGLPEFVAVQGRGTMELSGDVVAVADRVRLIDAARTQLDPANVVDQIEVDPDSALAGAELDAIIELVSVLPSTLVDGSVSFDGSAVRVRGTVLDADARAVLDDLAARRAVVLELSPRPVATADDARELQTELGDLLANSPIEFAPNSADLVAGTGARLDVIAATVKRFDGLVVTVEGHTDTAGNAQTNLDLSEFRAAVVYLELVQRGVPIEQLDFVGRGGESPIVVDGVEDRAASRRVELVVERVD